MLMVQGHVVKQTWSGVILMAKLCATKVRAIANSEPKKYGLVTQKQMGVVSLPQWVKPAPAAKEWTDATAGLSGVQGDGTHCKNHQGTWEARQGGLGAQRQAGINNRLYGFVWESERLIVAKKSRNWDGAKEPRQVHVSVRGIECRLNLIVLLRENWQ